MVDNLELMEKSKELEKQVLQQIENANKIKTELESVAMMRCQLALRVPNASFTSTDAFNLLEYWNITDSSLSILERAMLKNPINKKIQELETLEMAMDEIVNEYRDADMDLRSKEKSLQDARSKGVLAIQSEKRAREALQQAKLRITESKANVNQSTKALVQADMMLTRKGVDKEEAHANYKSWEEALQKARAESTLALQTETRAREALDQAKQEVKETKAIVNAAVKILAKSESFLGRRKMERDRLSNSVSKQQEIVRRSMQKKESEMGISDSQDNEIATWTKLKELERKEQDLIKQYDQLEVMATRTQSRANKLKRRAELLKNMD